MAQPTPDLVRRICAVGLLDAKTVRNYFRAPHAIRESSRLRVELALATLQGAPANDGAGLTHGLPLALTAKAGPIA